MEQQRFKISVDDECIYCRSRDSIQHAFLECFNDKYKVKLNLSGLQLVFKDYKPPSNVLVNAKRKFWIPILQT